MNAFTFQGFLGVGGAVLSEAIGADGTLYGLDDGKQLKYSRRCRMLVLLRYEHFKSLIPECPGRLPAVHN